MKIIEQTPLFFFLLLAVTLGLAPYTPPHIWEKLQMLFNGELKRAIDWFDLFLHATPWVLLGIKSWLLLKTSS